MNVPNVIFCATRVPQRVSGGDRVSPLGRPPSKRARAAGGNRGLGRNDCMTRRRHDEEIGVHLRPRHGATALAVVATATLLMAGAAGAHVTIDPSTAEQGSFSKISFRVPN